MSRFTIYPAVDLRHGQVVRLQFGDPNLQTTFDQHPAEAGRRWLNLGAKWLHVVNLDGAFGEKSAANWQLLPELTQLGGKVQFGGGIRSLADVERALTAGVTRVVLGTVAIEQPELVAQAITQFGSEAIAVGIDARDGEVKTRGWQTGSGVDPLLLAEKMGEAGVQTIIFTDISRDGVLTGVNVEKTAELAAVSGLSIIASGGVASLHDIRQVKAAGLAGVITGRAIYEGQLDLAQALALEI